MKLIKAKQTFKTVSQKQVELNPALADRLGRKREAVMFDLPQYESTDLPELLEQHSPVLLTCLNNALAQLAKDKFAANPVDWAYLPEVETDLSLKALAASFESVSRGRILTNETAKKLSDWITRNAAQIIKGIQTVDASYGATQLTAICAVMQQFTVYASKPRNILDKVLLRMEQISEAIAGDDSLVESFTDEPVLTEVFDALIKRFTKEDEEEITADSL